jgi:hypothetical protein
MLTESSRLATSEIADAVLRVIGAIISKDAGSTKRSDRSTGKSGFEVSNPSDPKRFVQSRSNPISMGCFGHLSQAGKGYPNKENCHKEQALTRELSR